MGDAQSLDAAHRADAVEVAEGFDRLYRATTRSAAYREGVRATANGLPEWLIPFSFLDETLLERIASELHVAVGDTFLDLACGAGGPGLWVAQRTGATSIGIDVAASAIAVAGALAESLQMTGRAHFAVADATATGLPEACLNGVMSIDALMFMDARRVAAEICRVLMPGGRLVFTAAESIGEPFRSTLVRDYREVFEAFGFRTIRHEEAAGHAERLRALYVALVERAETLREEMGDVADALLEEANGGLERAAAGNIRTREVLYVAERGPQS